MTIKRKERRDPNTLHLSSIQRDININLNSIKDEQKKKLLQKKRNKIMAQINNIVIHEKTAISSML